MSKMDALRAMREARYEQAAARAGQAAKTTPAKTAATTAARTAAKRKPPVAPPAEESGTPGQEPALCGHRNMSGRTCTREHGHSAKSHRYS
ncbi:hypothetical protein I601_0227 [Nocardioides dokdonensis FR1436]|uniref:Uncharacterized protein n=1 Tax=Nocardioides dokdonensis FR1436 TaxID=1300347 RepID=A0A1A9GG63_9ACTN|nr:hypothetical protein [Nocardioides dokdonensis]ANH36680.1 hypothetical protein I601_0227 [Nocardioides dokdonensis FR1436]